MNSSMEFISLLFEGSSQAAYQAAPLTSAPAGRAMKGSIKQPLPGLDRLWRTLASSKNKAAIGMERDHSGSLLLGYPKTCFEIN